MASFDEILTQVSGYIRDPSMLPVIATEINNTCSYLSRTGKFARDLREEVVELENGTNTVGALALNSLPGLRAVEWVMDFHTGDYFEHIDPRKHSSCPQAYYLAGPYLRFRGLSVEAELQIGYYAAPFAMHRNDPQQPVYWMLEVAPDAVTKFTAAALLDILGDEQAARSVRAEAVVAAEALKPYQSGVRA